MITLANAVAGTGNQTAQIIPNAGEGRIGTVQVTCSAGTANVDIQGAIDPNDGYITLLSANLTGSALINVTLLTWMRVVINTNPGSVTVKLQN